MAVKIREGEIVSRHFLRDKARESARRWNRRHGGPGEPLEARIEPYRLLGPGGFKVVLRRKKPRRPVD